MRARTDHHPRHDEHHQPRAWRTDDDGGVCGLGVLQPRSAVLACSDHRFCRGWNFRRCARSDNCPALLRQGTGGAGGHLGREPCPVPGLPAALWPLHAADPDPRGQYRAGPIFVFVLLDFYVPYRRPARRRPLVDLQPHGRRPPGPGDHAKSCDGASARGRHASHLPDDFHARRGARGAVRGVARANDIHHALHGPAVRGPGLHHGRRRRGD